MDIIVNKKKVGEIINRVWHRKIKNSDELFWNLGGSPCFDAEKWDSLNDQVDSFEVSLEYNGSRMIISKALFQEHIEYFDKGHGRQVGCRKEFWTTILAQIEARPKIEQPKGLFDTKVA